MSWLVAEERVLATLEIADSWRARLRGLVGRESLDGVLLIRPAFNVHTFGVSFPIDVAFCDGDMRVLDVVTMAPNRLGLPRVRARVVLEAEKGSFERWKIAPGDQLEVRE